MTSLLKNQILKHLSKFAKNLSPDQVNLSALKGEGELKNLELNEEVLTDLLELPSWLKLTEATCNRVHVRIQWTKLKSVPIQLSLDEVRVMVTTCEELRSSGQSGSTVHPPGGLGGPYGFADKVVDGMTLSVNSVILTLQSKVFEASFQISRIMVESKSPKWSKADLRSTRLKDTDKKELLIFKELSWTTIKIEAKSTVNEDLTPLRLITNLAKCRITIKKKLSDCSVLGCRLVLILDDLLWVLTDDQLRAALHFADSISGLVKRATEETQKAKGARKLENLSGSCDKMSKEKSSKKNKAVDNSLTGQLFAAHDVIETSYHIYLGQIDLHLCDDPGGNGRSSHPSLKDGGAFQITLSKLQMDFYPYHLSAMDRSSWIRYQKSIHFAWLENSLQQFKSELTDTLSSSQYHRYISKSLGDDANQHSVEHNILSKYDKLMTANLIVRLSNFSLWKVTTSKGKIIPKEFIKSDDTRCSFKDDMPVLHLEYTQFYYPGDDDFPLPPPKMYSFINPIQVYLDPLTCLWLNAFTLNLQQSVKSLSTESPEPPYLDVKIEAILLRVIYEDLNDYGHQPERPRSIEIQVSRVLAANYRSAETGTYLELKSSLEAFSSSDLFSPSSVFPNEDSDFHVICQKFRDVVDSEGHIKESPDGSSKGIFRKDLLWSRSKDIWYIALDPIWADFKGDSSVPLINAFPVTLWLYKDPHDIPLGSKQAKMHILSEVHKLVKLQISHYQMLFLQRMFDALNEITTFITHDLVRILGEDDEGSMCLGLLAPQADISLVISPPTMCDESHTEESNDNNDSVVQSKAAHEASSTPINSFSLHSGSISDTLNDSLKSSSKLMSSASKKMANGQLKARSKLTHSLTNIKASLDSSFRGSAAQLSLPPEEDSLSVRSEGSSDSESFIVINQHQSEWEKECIENTLFDLNPRTPIAIEAAEEITESYSIQENGGKKDCPNNLTDDRQVSIVTFHLDGIELANQSKGPHSLVKLKAAGFRGEESFGVKWDEFQNKFNSVSKDWKAKEKNNAWCAKLRFSSITPKDISDMLKVDPEVTLMDKIRRCKDNFVDVVAQNLPLSFHTSILTGIVDLFEDEIIPVPIPMQVQINNISLHLEDDRPPNNSTSPGTIPVDLNIPSLSIARDIAGVFSISLPNNNMDATTTLPTPCSDVTRRATLLGVENENLRASLALSQSDISSLKVKLQEQEQRNKRYSDTLKKVSLLEKENESMKLTLQYLQKELLKSGKKQVVP